MTYTHTYAELEVSPACYEEIAGKLRTAEYNHAFMEDGTIDMHGIGLTKQQEKKLTDLPPSPSPVTAAERERTCKCPYPPVVNEQCWCHERMGNDFWFLPADSCLYEKPNRCRDAWRQLCAKFKRG